MKGDFSRETFEATRHFSSVRQQQGRVQLDADWNEQAEINRHHLETRTLDVVGPSGAPIETAGFGVVPGTGPDFQISAGRMYVHGILAENEHAILLSQQPDPTGQALPTPNAPHLVYLEVWHRHETVIDQPDIREVALGGPDTTTRTRVVWQVRHLPAPPGAHCDSVIPGWEDATRSSTGRLRAQSDPPAPNPNACEVRPTAGYRGLENQLYRVEVHQGGAFNQTTFKWSRDNGSIETRVTGVAIDGNEVSLTVTDTGRDHVRGLAPDQWVEVSDDHDWRAGRPGRLLQISTVDHAEGVVVFAGVTLPFALDLNAHPRMRRWDHAANPAADESGIPATAGWLPLEQGVEIQLDPAGWYRTGDFWVIPARSATSDAETGNVEWPRVSGAAAWLPPRGEHHHFTRLAIIRADGSIEDCRELFPPLTRLVRLHYLGGDGQEVMPDLVTQPLIRPWLEAPLLVGVSNGQIPVVGARVRFRIVDPSVASGLLDGGGANTGTSIEVLTTSTGASCRWALDNNAGNPVQRVEVVLLDHGGVPTEHPPIFFTANLSIAAQVAYAPSGCQALTSVRTVQDALDTLCAQLDRFYFLGGDGQEVSPGAGGGLTELPQELRVGFSHGTTPVVGRQIRFTVETGDGRLLGPPNIPLPAVEVATDAQGARCRWQLNPAAGQPRSQRVRAEVLDGPNGNVLAQHPAIYFAATLTESGASCGEIEVRPGDDIQALVDTIPDDADAVLCFHPGEWMLERGTIEIARKRHVTLQGAGQGTRIRLRERDVALRFSHCASVTLRDLRIEDAERQVPQERAIHGLVSIYDCPDVTIQRLTLTRAGSPFPGSCCLLVKAGGDLNNPQNDRQQVIPARVRVHDCDLQVGHAQDGILLIDVERAELTGNRIAAGGNRVPFRELVRDEPSRARLARAYLVDRVGFVAPRFPPAPGKTFIRAGAADRAFFFETVAELADVWPLILRQNPFAGRSSEIRIRKWIVRLSRWVLAAAADVGDRAILAGQDAVFARLFVNIDRVRSITARRAITVGGRIAPNLFQVRRWPDLRNNRSTTIRTDVPRQPDLVIQGNRLLGFSEGIHMALSHNSNRRIRDGVVVRSRSNLRGRRLRLYRVLAGQNTIHLHIDPAAEARHGIFVGNAHSITVQDNLIEVVAPPPEGPQLGMPASTGIRIHGSLGPLLMVSRNHITGCRRGVDADGLNPFESANRRWRVVDNATDLCAIDEELSPAMP
jgi:hypothetical protein